MEESAFARSKGILLIVLGSILWGASGPMMEWVLNNTSLSVSFFLTVRLITAGICILLFLLITGQRVFLIWKDISWLKQLVVFGVLGMLGVQYTFVAAIEASNASIATLLQFLGPVYIILFLSWKNKIFPPKYQVIGIIGTLIGLFLLLTNANVSILLISREALLWGLAVGIAFSIYTVYPARLMKEWGVLVVVGWGMLIGGVVLAFVTQIWKTDEWVHLAAYPISIIVIIIILIGTIAFILFLSSMKYITAVETSILSSIEPLTAMIISVFWFNQILGAWQYIGVVIMLLFVTWLSVAGEIKWISKRKG
ncbi:MULTISPECIES: DMT family transporter [Psychrobacillus]|uniref:DMT family transporter n=1 Tax=Psychrobacillus TaxID=1221880 RepID=UPI0008E2B0CE|nr:EamA family transporter [Psychrobacillus psychrodurans]MCZ8538864.1 DMT family transporter [Psychrobacillus psychrodurans]SFM23626.1 Threonine/homoserine efflux transporter RhtA [Psychrobacillus psychrodurans]